MKSHPLISIITVCYNAGPILSETLQSATEQTFTDFELVIIDGKSVDNTIEVAKRFDKFTGTLLSEPDKGIYDAMNKGIKAAKGEWLYFLNAGDAFYNKEVLSSVFLNQKIEAIDFIYAKVQTKNEPTGIDYLNGKEISYNDFFSHYPICHQATFARKSLFDKLGYFNLDYPLVADSEWFIRIFKDKSIKKLFLDAIIAFYDIQGATYQKRMQGYREYIQVGFKQFPFTIAVKNMLMHPLIWLKVKIIRTFQNRSWFKKYRTIKFKNKLAQP
ncbi:MAG: glycosyltransferase [Bacteroidia bacterium]|nr:glycosyltransferase [Bacteroidia bacterium]